MKKAKRTSGVWNDTALSPTRSVSRLLQSSGGPEGRRSRRPHPSCSVGGHRQEVWEGHLRPVLDGVGPVLSLSPSSASSLDGALHDGFGEGSCSMYFT